MLDMRRSEDADGESMMMGSARLEDTGEVRGFEGRGAGRLVSWAVRELWLGREEDLLPFAAKSSLYLRTWEKSWLHVSDGKGWAWATYCWLDSTKNGVVVNHFALTVVDLL